MKIRDEAFYNLIGERTYFDYFRNNTITYVDIYYGASKIYTGYVLKDSLTRRWAEGSYWTEFSIAHVMMLLDTKYVNFKTTELGAFSDLTRMVLAVLPPTRLVYTVDTMRDDEDNIIIPPYTDSGAGFTLTVDQFAGEYVSGDLDIDLIPETGFLQLGRETMTYSGFTTDDSPYNSKKIIIFTVDRTPPAYGSTEYWDLETFMILQLDTTYQELITEYNLTLDNTDLANSYYWTLSPYGYNYITQADYDEAGGETTIPYVIGFRKRYFALSPSDMGYAMDITWFNNVLEDDLALGYYSPAPLGRVKFDYDVRPVYGNFFSYAGHTAYNFAYYTGIDVSTKKIWLQKIYLPSLSDTTIVSWSDSGSITIQPGYLVYTGDNGMPEVASTGFFPYVRFYPGEDNVYDFQFLQKPDGGYQYILIVYKNGSNYELRTYKVDVDFGDDPTTSEFLAGSTLWEWCSAGVLLSTKVIGTSKPVLLRNVAGLSTYDADTVACRTRTYYLDEMTHEYQIEWATQEFSDNPVVQSYVTSVEEIIPDRAVGILSYFSINASNELRRVVRVPTVEIDIEDETALDVLNVYRKLKLAIMYVDSDNVLRVVSLSSIFDEFDFSSATELLTENIEWMETEVYDYRNITIGDDSFIKTERVRTYYKLRLADLLSEYTMKTTIKYRSGTFLPLLTQVKYRDESGILKYGVITGYNIVNTDIDMAFIEYNILAFNVVYLSPILSELDVSEVYDG